MNISNIARFLLGLLLCCPLLPLRGADAATERPFLHPLFTDHAVLQRGVRLPVWGWATPGERIEVTMNGKRVKATAAADGYWQVKLGPFPAGGPHTLQVRGSKTVTVSDILMGDVWICSGQSNMEWPVAASNQAEQEIAQANHPKIRLFTVPKRIAFEPVTGVDATWQLCTPQTIGRFSAVGYFFGRHLQKELGVPIGLIHSSWGGTVAEAWTSAEALRTMADFRPEVDRLADVRAALERGDQNQLVEQWYVAKDPGTAKNWQKTDTDVSSWKEATLPNDFEQIGLPAYDGIAWFQRTFDAPAGWAGKDLVLRLGPIDDYDTTWFNGVRVGSTDRYDAPRVYRVPGNAVRAGRNVITVRVLDTGGGGGLVGQPEQLQVHLAGDETSSIPLAGAWRLQGTVAYARIQPVPAASANNPNTCTVLYNGMIAPLVPFAVKGAIWYQGESNADRAYQYRTLLPTLIRDWHARFRVREFGFHIVSLANFMKTSPEPVDHPWAGLREAQALTTKAVPNCGIAMAIDIGDAADIHPRNKQEVGRRLGLSALAVTYGRKIDWSGPWYRSMKTTPQGIRLKFDHVDGGLVAPNGPLKGFAIAGADRKFVWADARIDGKTVVVSSPKVPQPVAVRYNWDANPVGNLYNQAGLPAVPFRTDDWR